MCEISDDIIDLCFQDFNNLKKPPENIINTLEKNCCENFNYVEDNTNGVIVCIGCGIVKSDVIIDNSPEWNFGGEDSQYQNDPARCGAPINPLLSKSSLSTTINTKQTKNNWLMLRLHQQQSMDYTERSLYHIFEGINKLGKNLTPAILESAKSIYKDLSEKKLSRGAVRQCLIACCIMRACQMHNVPRSVKEISEMCNVDLPKLNQTVHVFHDVMGSWEEIDSTINYIIRFCNKLGLEKSIERSTVKKVRSKLIELEDNHLLIGKTPTAILASVIYITLTNELNLNVNKKLLCEQFSVSVVTINKIIQIIEKK